MDGADERSPEGVEHRPQPAPSLACPPESSESPTKVPAYPRRRNKNEGPRFRAPS